jgi:hypothetical protein
VISPLDVPFPNINSVFVNPDPRGSIPVVTFLGDLYSGSCPLNKRTCRLTNACGLTTDLVQTITINDNTPPTGNPPAPDSIACFSQVPPPITNLFTNLSDDCGIPYVIF